MKKEIIEDFLEKLDDYQDISSYGCDLAYLVFEQYNTDESVTYNTQEAKEWVFKYDEEVSDVIEKLDYDTSINPLRDYEKIMVIVYLEVAHEYLLHSKTIEENWDKEITLDKKIIEKIKKELIENIEKENI